MPRHRMELTDIKITEVELFFLPVRTRIPLKFGPETLTEVTCARARVGVVDGRGGSADGWGETPLSVQWVWPSSLSYQARNERLKIFCEELARSWLTFRESGHPLELGYRFQEDLLPDLQKSRNAHARGADAIPWLAALVCSSPFDLALHDAYGRLHHQPIYHLYEPPFLKKDLAHFMTPAPDAPVNFNGRYPADFLTVEPPRELPAWHLVGGLDLLDPSELSGQEPRDGYPVLLRDWIRRDGLKCLKVKLRGNDPPWDFSRLVAVGRIGLEEGVNWLSADFNCTVEEPAYVNRILDQLRDEHPRLYGMLLYVEQPFAYDLEQFAIDVHSVSARKPLFLDESAHDWKVVRRGRELGWSGVALKTCKTQTGALLSLCWAKAHGMGLMVQDLSNPMLAQIPHVLLAAHAGTIMGVETNSMQFYPAASAPEAAVHPGLYQRTGGKIDLSSLRGPGFGYRIGEIQRTLPEPAFRAKGLTSGKSGRKVRNR